MASLTENKSEAITLPAGVKANLEENILEVKGPLGVVTKDFSKIPVKLSIQNDGVQVSSLSTRKRHMAVFGTAASLVSNMVVGVTKSFTYRLKLVYAHFPVSIKVKGKDILIENFYGERVPRIARIVGECQVKVEGDDVVVTGVNREHVGQTAANIEQRTRIKRKDQRVFLDGIYIYERKINA